jgi:hypothetical protein
MSSVVTEFGGTAPHSLSEYVRGGAYVTNGPSQNASISTTVSGLNLSQFAGAIKGHTVSLAYSSGSTSCSYTPPGQTSCIATETVAASVSGGVGPFTYAWTEVSDPNGKYTFPGSTTASTCAVRSTAGDGTWTATVRCTVTDTGSGSYAVSADYNLSHDHTAI